jgi:hypothetical protein
MVILPGEWQHNNGNIQGLNTRTVMDNNIHEIQKGIISKKTNAPLIVVPQIKPLNTMCLTKDFSGGIDSSFKERGKVLSDNYFRDLPKIIQVSSPGISGYHNPSIMNVNDLERKSRQFNKVFKKNEFGFDKTATKEMINKIVYPEDVSHAVYPKNTFNYVVYGGGYRGSKERAPIIPIKQYRKKLIEIK